jgi:hypothetical protein
MPLLWNITDVKDCMDVCYEHKTGADLEEGETLETLVNPPDRPLNKEEREEHKQRYIDDPGFWGRSDRPFTEEELEEVCDGVKVVSHSPYPWEYEKNEDGSEDRTRIMRMSPATFTIIHNVSTVGMNEITEKNWKEVWTRLNIVEHVFTNGIGGEDKPTGRGTATMPSVVASHIGMRLPNTAPLTSKQFNSKMGEWLRKDAENRLGFLLHHYPKEGVLKSVAGG